MPMSWAANWSMISRALSSSAYKDIIIGLSEQYEGWTGPDDEYPHYAFYLNGPNFELMKNWLDRLRGAQLSLSAGRYRAYLFPRSRPAIFSSFTAIPAMRGLSRCHWLRDAEVHRSISAVSIITGIVKAPRSMPAKYTEAAVHGFCTREHFLPRSRTGETFLHEGHRRRADSRR